MDYAELYCFSNFTFLTGASHPHELAEQAAKLGYQALAITDTCSVAGIPRAWAALRNSPVRLITGSHFRLCDAPPGADPALPEFVLLARTRTGYGQLCRLITTGRCRAEKGHYQLYPDDLRQHPLDDCLCLWLPPDDHQAGYEQTEACGLWLLRLFGERFRIAASRTLEAGEEAHLERLRRLSRALSSPITAVGAVHMHKRERQPLQDVLTAIRHNTPVEQAGHALFQNGERYLRPVPVLKRLFPQSWLDETRSIARQCTFNPGSLRYEYPPDLVPDGQSSAAYLQQLTREGERRRFPEGTPLSVQALIRKELALIAEMQYEHYFLTIHDIVSFARSQGILCQGRGSAANSAVCFCLGITEVNPTRVELLFERFISKDRNEPPDIDVDFEHERREEVIQYIYRRYSRERAALAATVIRYRPRSAIRDVGKALGFDTALVEKLLNGIDWRDRETSWRQQILDKGLTRNPSVADQFFHLVNTLLGFPRHLSQHVGGFVISAGPLSELVPVENAAMEGRTVIQWDKDDLESLGLMKVDILALGMLSAIRKSLALIADDKGHPFTIQDIPEEDPDTYNMLQQGDSIGVFQVESRAQINMLPRLRPETFYDLVIEVAIVRPGPIQGDMVHPYLRRKHGLEPVDFPSDPDDQIRGVLGRTLGVPIFQEQVIKLAMVAAGFTAGEADRLRRAMAAWKSDGDLTPFRDKLISGMLARGHDAGFAERLYQQICGFGGYGFPESHAASFALLVYVSAWIKRHHPAAFYCGLLNSQPMGVYSPSQLIQDARRHSVTVLPPDINHSHRAHTLQGSEKHLRLGLRIIQGLSSGGADRIHQHRPEEGYRSVAELRNRARLSQRDMELLAGANAMPDFSSNRHQAYWQLLEHEEPAELFAGEVATDYTAEHCQQLPEPTEGQSILADYASTGLTLQRHPMALLREQGHLQHCFSAEQLKTVKPGIPVQVAGLVTGRQRPGSASGVTFVTLEDETGNTNVVVWLETARRQRRPLLTARLLHVKGVLEREGDIVHVIAGKLTDLSHLIDSLPVVSRDFH
jgi:error-prone DNA polymerase